MDIFLNFAQNITFTSAPPEVPKFYPRCHKIQQVLQIIIIIIRIWMVDLNRFSWAPVNQYSDGQSVVHKLCLETQASHLYWTNKVRDQTVTMQFLEKKVQVGKDQEKAQSEKDSHSKNQGGKKPN